MSPLQNIKTGGVATFFSFVSVACGLAALILCGVYQAQRSGLLSHAWSRFIQHHLEGFGCSAFVAGIIGLIVGARIISLSGRSRIALVGFIFSLVSMFWQLLLPL
jgi:hypothetical protein